MTGEGEDGPLGVGLDVPDPDGLVVGPAHYPGPVELNAADALRVSLEGSHVTLASQPRLPQLEPLPEH